MDSLTNYIVLAVITTICQGYCAYQLGAFLQKRKMQIKIDELSKKVDSLQRELAKKKHPKTGYFGD